MTPRTSFETMARVSLFVVVFLLLKIVQAAVPASIYLQHGKYLNLHVGNPGDIKPLQVNFAINVTYIDFDPREDSTSATTHSEIFYLGLVPIRLPFSYTTTNELALGKASPLWNTWHNYTYSPNELVLGSSAAWKRLVITRCGMQTPPDHIIFDPSTEETTLPPDLYDAGDFSVVLGGCTVSIKKSHMSMETALGVEVDMRRRGELGSKIHFGRPPIARNFVLLQDMRSGDQYVGVSAEITRPLPIVAIGMALTAAVVCTAAMAEVQLSKGPMQQSARFVAHVVCFVGAAIAAISPPALALTELRLRGLLPGLPLIIGTLSAVVLVSVFWSTHWLVSAGFVTLWLISLWDVGDFTGVIYRLLWPTCLAVWQGLLAHLRGGVDIALFVLSFAFAIIFGAYPIIDSVYGQLPGIVIPICVLYTAILLVMIFTLNAYHTIRAAKGSPFSKELLFPLGSRLKTK